MQKPDGNSKSQKAPGLPKKHRQMAGRKTKDPNANNSTATNSNQNTSASQVGSPNEEKKQEPRFPNEELDEDDHDQAQHDECDSSSRRKRQAETQLQSVLNTDNNTANAAAAQGQVSQADDELLIPGRESVAEGDHERYW